MKTKTQGGLKVSLIFLFVAGVGPGAVAQWQIGQQVSSPPAVGNYFSMRLGAGAPPLPLLPCDVPVYCLGTIPGTTNNAFAYDDRLLSAAGRSSTQAAADVPPVPGDGNGGGGGGDTNAPTGTLYNYGTNLCIIIGPLTNRQAWLVLSNTHSPTYYQLLSRSRVNADPWGLGQIVQDTGTTHQVGFNNVPAEYPSPTFFRGVGGNTVASIGLDPDWNLAVAPPPSGGSGQAGKFRVFLSPPPSSGVTAVYQVSGSASNGLHYTTLSGTVYYSSQQRHG